MPGPARAVLVLALLYLFLVGVRLLESGINGLGSDFTDALFENVTNPISGLFVGMLATVLVQSSSVTTATIVGLVAAGVIDVEAAVPMVMGANIGTTVTNTIVSLAHVRRSEEFRRAFAAATMHDFFNIVAVAVLLPLQIATGLLSKVAAAISRFLAGGEELGGTFDSPIKGAVKWLGGMIEDALDALVGPDRLLAALTILLAIAVIFVTLTFITKNMKVLVAARIERTLNAALARSGLVGMVVGTIVTVAVQSSSITTSILIPLVASGILTVRNAYPITLGANVGTTITALLAALGAGKVDGLTIAVTHTLFNLTGILLLYPWPKIRYLPVVAAEHMAAFAIRHKTAALGYTVGFFLILPIVGIFVFR